MSAQMTAPRPTGIGEGRGADQLAAKSDSTALALAINQEHQAAHRIAKTAIAHAIKAGELLLSAKSKVSHGEWLTWVNENCEFSTRTATGYMRLALLPAANRQRVADLSLRQSLDVLAEPRKKSLPDKHLFAPKTTAAVEPEVVHEHDAGGHHRDHHQDQHHQVDAGEHHHVEHRETMQIADIKVMPRGYWRTIPGAQVQFLDALLSAWDESSDETREKFLLHEDVKAELLRLCRKSAA